MSKMSAAQVSHSLTCEIEILWVNEGNPAGAMGLPDYLGWQWRSKAGIPIVCVPGCPTMPDNITETLLHLLYQAAGATVVPDFERYMKIRAM
ncbi:MAG TPA: hypothetical protein VHU19_02825 [Pyrinomonadaceae bacterium]|jgi:Ni,Fe-hydrogenase I small subunit|nr:hypothetical protein [Pyrinomonadaceae bacterium]